MLYIHYYLYWRYVNDAPLWMKPSQKYRTVAITFYPTLSWPTFFMSGIGNHVLNVASRWRRTTQPAMYMTMWKCIGWQRQRRTCYRVQYHNVAWCSIYECLFELSSTTNILHFHLVHNKNTFPPTILEMYVSLPALTETCFEVNTLGEFALIVQYAL